MDDRQASLSVDALNDLLFSVHLGIAAIIHQPEFALDAEESRKLAIASANVMRHYNVKTTAKAMDWIQLTITLGIVYGPRIVTITARRNVIKQAPKPEAQAGVAAAVEVRDPAMMMEILGG